MAEAKASSGKSLAVASALPTPSYMCVEKGANHLVQGQGNAEQAIVSIVIPS